MNDQFLFFCVNIGNESLLKEEVRIFYPELSLSYSRKGFLTFKNKGVKYNFQTISQLQITFATRVGICLGKAKPSELKEKLQESLSENSSSIDECMLHSFSINTDFEYMAKDEFIGHGVNQYSSDNKLVINLIALSDKEIWFGVHRVAKGITRYPNSMIQIDTPRNIPSVGYQKLAEVMELFSLKLNSRDNWLDFGCSPGGSSSYLLSKKSKVWGIDTAKVDQTILAHSNFKFIKSSVQDLSQEGLPDGEVHWVHADLNLNPKQAIREVLRLCKKYNHSLKGIVFTVQIVRTDLIEHIEEFEDIFYDWGFSNMLSRQVPSHKNEYVLIARRRA